MRWFNPSGNAIVGETSMLQMDDNVGGLNFLRCFSQIGRYLSKHQEIYEFPGSGILPPDKLSRSKSFHALRLHFPKLIEARSTVVDHHPLLWRFPPPPSLRNVATAVHNYQKTAALKYLKRLRGSHGAQTRGRSEGLMTDLWSQHHLLNFLETQLVYLTQIPKSCWVQMKAPYSWRAWRILQPWCGRSQELQRLEFRFSNFSNVPTRWASASYI